MVSTPMNGIARFEFRLFGNDLKDEFQRVVSELKAMPIGITTSTETYIASRFTINSIAKITDEGIDVKTLERRSGVLELWQPYFKATLPVSSADFSDHIAAQLGANIDLPEGLLSRSDILDLCADQPGLAPIEVTKARERLSIQEGFAEIVDLSIAGTQAQSIAFESRNEAVVSGVLKKLRIAEPLNENYPAYLQRLAFR
jgi:hypothetical protein